MPGRGWSQAERAMRPVGVVVLDVDPQDTLEVSAVCDQEPVEAVATNRADPALGERVRVRGPKWGADDLNPLAFEDVVEGATELAVAIMDEETDRPRALRESPGKLSCLLGCPTPIGVGAAAREVHTPRAEFDEEEHIQAPEPEGLDGEEVARDDRRGVGRQELAPAELGASAGRRDAALPEDLGDRRRRHSLTDTCQLADDPLISPARVLTCKTQNQVTDLLRDSGPTRCPSGVRPPSPYKLAMPAKQRVRANEERRPARSAQHPAGCSQEHAVSLLKPRTSALAAKNRELVPQHHDLELLELTRAQTQRRDRQRSPKQ
jgi:hypothetical protein